MPDAMVIDVDLPDMDGRGLCARLRADGIRAPALFLVPRDADPWVGSDLVAVAHLLGPFRLDEVVEEVRVLRCSRAGTPIGSARGRRRDRQLAGSVHRARARQAPARHREHAIVTSRRLGYRLE